MKSREREATTNRSCFQTEHQGANLPSFSRLGPVLDRGQQIVGLLWSADFLPRREHLFAPRLLSKNRGSNVPASV